MRNRLGLLFAGPLVRRCAFHFRRLTHNVDRSFFTRLFLGLFGFVLAAALLVTAIEGFGGDVGGFFAKLSDSVYWAVTTVMGSVDPDAPTLSPGANTPPA